MKVKWVTVTLLDALSFEMVSDDF